MINLCVFLVLYPPNFPDLCLCARNPTLSKFLSWDLHLPAYFCVCLFFALFWGVPLIDITCVFLCILIFLSSHAFTVSFGLCQHLPSGENSLQVAVCVCVCSKTNHEEEANTGCDHCSEIRVIWKDPEAVCGLWCQDATSLSSCSDTVQMRSDKWLERSELGLGQSRMAWISPKTLSLLKPFYCWTRWRLDLFQYRSGKE